MIHTRESLDRKLLEEGTERLTISCELHDGAAVVPVYKNGRLRLLCQHCGFAVADVKVALDGEEGGR